MSDNSARLNSAVFQIVFFFISFTLYPAHAKVHISASHFPPKGILEELRVVRQGNKNIDINSIFVLQRKAMLYYAIEKSDCWVPCRLFSTTAFRTSFLFNMFICVFWVYLNKDCYDFFKLNISISWVGFEPITDRVKSTFNMFLIFFASRQLVLRLCVPHFLPNSGGIAYWVFASTPEWRNENIKYIFFPVGTDPFVLCPWATATKIVTSIVLKIQRRKQLLYCVMLITDSVFSK